MANKLNEVKVGNTVKVTKQICGHGFGIGQLVEVVRVGSVDILAKGNNTNWYLHPDEFEIVKPLRVKDGRVWRKGDKAVIKHAEITGHGFYKGTIVTVTEVDFNGRADFAKDANGVGYFVENEELEPYVAPKHTNGFKLGDVIYLVHVGTFMHLTAESTLKLANESSATAVRIATEDERRKHLGLPPVKKDDDRITINITVSRKALRDGVDILGKASKAYELYSKLDDLNDEVNK